MIQDYNTAPIFHYEGPRENEAELYRIGKAYLHYIKNNFMCDLPQAVYRKTLPDGTFIEVKTIKNFANSGPVDFMTILVPRKEAPQAKEKKKEEHPSRYLVPVLEMTDGTYQPEWEVEFYTEKAMWAIIGFNSDDLIQEIDPAVGGWDLDTNRYIKSVKPDFEAVERRGDETLRGEQLPEFDYRPYTSSGITITSTENVHWIGSVAHDEITYQIKVNGIAVISSIYESIFSQDLDAHLVAPNGYTSTKMMYTTYTGASLELISHSWHLKQTSDNKFYCFIYGKRLYDGLSEEVYWNTNYAISWWDYTGNLRCQVIINCSGVDYVILDSEYTYEDGVNYGIREPFSHLVSNVRIFNAGSEEEPDPVYVYGMVLNHTRGIGESHEAKVMFGLIHRDTHIQGSGMARINDSLDDPEDDYTGDNGGYLDGFFDTWKEKGIFASGLIRAAFIDIMKETD